MCKEREAITEPNGTERLPKRCSIDILSQQETACTEAKWFLWKEREVRVAFLAFLCAGVALAGFVEYWSHTRRVLVIPIRVHVNGTRGKSTTTRLIAAGLRAGGLRVVAKTTGTAARLILEDGSELPVRRRGRGRGNIAEQMKTVALAAKRRADALVLECMALEPENQWVSEHRMIRSTIGVITNVRDDHLDVMGPRLLDVARALSLTIPREGCLVTAENAFLDVFMERARALGTSVHVADASEVPDEVNAAFSYVSFKENVACALKVCELAGVARDVAISGMLSARGDPGAMRVLRIPRGSGDYVLVNAFAANDYTSTMLIWRMIVEGSILRDVGEGMPVAVVMNNRADRIPRIRELSRLVACEVRPRYVFLIGEAARIAEAELARSGMDLRRVVDVSSLDEPRSVLDKIESQVPGGAVLFAVGNTKGMGQRLAEFFERDGETL